MRDKRWKWLECVIDINLPTCTPRTSRYVLVNIVNELEVYMEKGQYQLYPTRQVAEEKMTELNAISS